MLMLGSIVAVTGLAGHAFGSFAEKPDKMWLRDSLPQALGNRARILVYGYQSQIKGPNAVTSILQDLSERFWRHLMLIRRDDSVSVDTRNSVFILADFFP